MFVHVLTTLKASQRFLDATIAAVLHHNPSQHVSSLFFDFISVLMADVSSKVESVAQELTHSKLFVHLIDELVSFHKQLYDEFGYAPGPESALVSAVDALEGSEDALDAWLRVRPPFGVCSLCMHVRCFLCAHCLADC